MSGVRLTDIVERGLEIDDIESCASYHFSSEDDLVRALGELNALYVLHREKLQQKSLNARLASAYLYLYFTSNVPKLFKLLSFLPHDLIGKIAKTVWIDFGAGPATYTLAWYAWLKSHNIPYPPEALVIEKDLAMIELANNVLDKFLHHEQIHVAQSIQQKKISGATLFFGHSCNELPLEELLHLIEEVAPQFILFLEPGTPAVFQLMSDLRSHLIQRDYQVHYPCLTNTICPMKKTTNWCHQYLHLRLSPTVERIAQMAALKRQHSAVIFHVYEKKLSLSKQSSFPEEGHFRIIQGPEKTKGIWKWQVCSSKGELSWMETLTRFYDHSQLTILGDFTPGQLLKNIQLVKQLQPNSYRVLIGQL